MNWDDFKNQCKEAPDESMLPQSKSSIKIIKNTKGLNWEIKIVDGTEKEQLEALRKAAMEQHEILMNQLNEGGNK